MKGLLLLLVALLLLAGCTGHVGPDATVPATQPTAPTSTATLYVPGSELEIRTGGALRVYDIKSDGWLRISGFRSQILLAGANEVWALNGEEGAVSASVRDFAELATELNGTVDHTAYYSQATCSVHIADARLHTTVTRRLPEGMTGSPVIDLHRNEAYYIVGAEIRAMKLDTGVARLLRQHTDVTALAGVCFNGDVLVLKTRDGTGKTKTEYISTENGQTLGEDANALEMVTWEDSYFITREDGRILQTLFGTRTGEPKALEVSGKVFPALRMHGAVACEETETGLRLSFYDLNTGMRTAKTLLSGVSAPISAHCDGTYIWLLASENESQRLLRWDISKSPIQEQKIYTATFYTPEAPNTEALTACQTLADIYAQQYGVKIHIWENATTVTGGYGVTGEYRPETIEAMLEELRPILEVFPENFLLKTVEAGWIRIHLVREIDGGKDWTHFWEGKDCHILLSANGNAGALFLHGLAYAVDSHVLGNSRDFDFDRWNPLNPVDFAYSNEPVKPAYLTGDTRAFADPLAATSILEDRCSIFYNAIIGGNADMFKAPIMQAKLKRLCMGIREAYGLQKSEKNYLWERYLATSLAYQK